MVGMSLDGRKEGRVEGVSAGWDVLREVVCCCCGGDVSASKLSDDDIRGFICTDSLDPVDTLNFFSAISSSLC